MAQGERQQQQQQQPKKRPHPSLPHQLEHLQRTGRRPTAAAPFLAVPHSCLTPIEAALDVEGDLKSERLLWFQTLMCSWAAHDCCRCTCHLSHHAAAAAATAPARLPAGAILLGFTRDGCHLLSYTTQPVAAADSQEGYCLQLWSFQRGARCRRLWNVPLFRWVGGCAGGVAAAAALLCYLSLCARHLHKLAASPIASYLLVSLRWHYCCRRCRTPGYQEALADEDDFMAGDDMLLTLAEAPDSSLLGKAACLPGLLAGPHVCAQQ